MSFIHEYQVIIPILYKIPALNIELAVKLKKHTSFSYLLIFIRTRTNTKHSHHLKQCLCDKLIYYYSFYYILYDKLVICFFVLSYEFCQRAFPDMFYFLLDNYIYVHFVDILYRLKTEFFWFSCGFDVTVHITCFQHYLTSSVYRQLTTKYEHLNSKTLFKT